MLGRIRKALGEGSTSEQAEAGWTAIPREFKRTASHDREHLLNQLVERLTDYDAHVVEVGPGDVPAAVERLLTERGKRRLVVPAGVPSGMLPAGFEMVEDSGFSPAELDSFEGVVTMATVAIAETGSFVLQHVAGQGRRAASLVPDYHLCIIKEADVVETVPEAIARLQPTASLATTFVSGPSATADIEMTRIKGVHGPRFLDVILVREIGPL